LIHFEIILLNKLLMLGLCNKAVESISTTSNKDELKNKQPPKLPEEKIEQKRTDNGNSTHRLCCTKI
uniref:hypothetical protein n=1 Tax=Acinetobacter baumannii TaxID=470 RepID=UPI001BB26746